MARCYRIRAECTRTLTLKPGELTDSRRHLLDPFRGVLNRIGCSPGRVQADLEVAARADDRLRFLAQAAGRGVSGVQGVEDDSHVFDLDRLVGEQIPDLRVDVGELFLGRDVEYGGHTGYVAPSAYGVSANVRRLRNTAPSASRSRPVFISRQRSRLHRRAPRERTLFSRRQSVSRCRVSVVTRSERCRQRRMIWRVHSVGDLLGDHVPLAVGLVEDEQSVHRLIDDHVEPAHFADDISVEVVRGRERVA